jgi:hypothetical protein
VQQSHSALAAEVSELRRHTKREGVNMDYLKNVVLQVRLFALYRNLFWYLSCYVTLVLNLIAPLTLIDPGLVAVHVIPGAVA